MKRWEDLLAAEWGLRGGGDTVNGGVVFFDGVAYDLESTGFDERTLHDAMRHYLGPDGYDLTRFDGAPLLRDRGISDLNPDFLFLFQNRMTEKYC